MTAGYRMMWFDKTNENVIFLDERKEVKPNIIARWENLPFKNNTFDLVNYDPPYGIANKIGNGNINKCYGVLKPESFYSVLTKAFKEAFRVLKPDHFLIFKWGEMDKPLNSILATAPIKPLFGQKANVGQHERQVYWVTFLKPDGEQQNG